MACKIQSLVAVACFIPGRAKDLKGRHFSSDAEVIAAAETWLDGKHSDFFFFEWLAKVSLVAVVCFIPGRAKDLSAPLYVTFSRG